MAPSLVVEESEETTLEAEGNWMDEEEDVAEEGNTGKGHEQVSGFSLKTALEVFSSLVVTITK